MRRFMWSVLALGLCATLAGCSSNKSPDKSTDNAATGQLSHDYYALVAKSISDNKLSIAAVGLPKSSQRTKISGVFDRIKTTLSVNADQEPSSDETDLIGIAKISADTKQIQQFDDQNLIYLKQIDSFDHAQKLALYNVKTSQEKIVYSTQDDYAIDEYVISPDKTHAAIWEVAMDKDSNKLLGGYSKVTNFNISLNKTEGIVGPQKTEGLQNVELSQAIQSLDQRVFVQYPLFYDSNNTLWLDTFGPNSGGWGNSIYTLKSSSGSMEPVPSLKAGSYSSDPVISDDGRTILVARPKSPFSNDRTGVMDAQSYPNRLVFINITNMEEKEVAAGGFYANYVISNEGSRFSTLKYSDETSFKDKTSPTLQSGSLTDSSDHKIDSVYFPLAVIADKSETSTLLGKTNAELFTVKGESQILASNVGKKYSLTFAAYRLTGKNSIQEVDSNNFNEFISLRMKTNIKSLAENSATKETADNLKLDGYLPRNITLSSSRVGTQQAPSYSQRCAKDIEKFTNGSDLIQMSKEWFKYAGEELKKTPVCKTLFDKAEFTQDDRRIWDTSCAGTFSTAQYKNLKKISEEMSDPYCVHEVAIAFNNVCHQTWDVNSKKEPGVEWGMTPKISAQLTQSIKCLDSPLYIYPLQETNISIKANNSVYRTSPPDKSGSWDVTAFPDGKLLTQDGQLYSKIEYDYTSNPTSLNSGIIATQENLAEKLAWYADQLGLNKKEKQDFVGFWSEKLRGIAPFIQISHFSRSESLKINSFDISPQPDTLIPVVMYFRPLQLPSKLQDPVFEPILERKGFTVVDWSGVVDLL